MDNRLQKMAQYSLVLMLLSCFTNYGLSQTCPDTDGNFFDIMFFNGYAPTTDIIVPSGACTATFMYPDETVPNFSVGFNDRPGTSISNFAKSSVPSFMPNDIVPVGTNIEITYIVFGISNGMNVRDTFCMEVNYLDGTPPVPPAAPAAITVTYPNFPAAMTQTFTDDCDGAILVPSVDSGSGFCPATNTTIIRTWMAMDMSGNTSTISQQINVLGNMPPTFNINLMDRTVSCEDAGTFAQWLTDTDNSVMSPGNISDENLAGLSSVVRTPDPAPNLVGTCNETVTITYTVEDECGLTATTSVNFTVTDSTAPTMTFSPALTTLDVDCENIPAPQTPTVVDNCTATADIDVVFSQTSTQTSDAGCSDFSFQIVRTWVATDACNNSTSQSQTINVTDSTAPTYTFTGMSNITIDCSDSRAQTATGTVTNVMDACDTSPTVTFSEIATATGTCPQYEILNRTWIVSDACGNSSTVTQTINIVDTTPPTITTPADLTIDCGESTDPADTGMATATEPAGCDPNPMITLRDSMGIPSCPNQDTIFRFWIAEDACGNKDSSLQTIIVIDTIAPMITGGLDTTMICGSSTDAITNFENWLNNNAGSVITDACSNVTMFYEYTGTNVLANASSFADSLNNPVCPSPIPGVFLDLTVDFIAIDGCGNRDSIRRTFIIEDTVAPTLTECPTSMTVNTDAGVCENNLLLAVPIIEDACNNRVSAPMVTASAPVTSANPGDLETIVDPVNLSFAVDAPPAVATAAASLEIIVLNGDLEQPEEFFFIQGEDGSNLGQTGHPMTQCANDTVTVTISAAQYNMWSSDGQIDIQLVPNIPAGLANRFSVNDICGLTRVNGSLSYFVQAPRDLVFSYTVNGTIIDTLSTIAPFNHIFELGTNTVVYDVADCAGNTNSCTFDITVEDNEAPQIDCPTDMVISTDPGICTVNTDVPLFTSVIDNCAVTTSNVELPDNYDPDLTFVLNPNYGVNMAEDKVIIFNNLLADATPGMVQLILDIRGDVDDAGGEERFEVFDENNNSLGVTGVGLPNACDTISTFVFNIPSTTYNAWAADGFTVFPVESFIEPTNMTADAGINPCGMLDANNKDGISVLNARIEYETVAPQFSITGATTVAEITLNPPLVPQNHTLNPGTNVVTYSVTDLAGNTNSCSFNIEVVDTEAPTAMCVPPLFVEINPSGFVNDTIFTSEIDAGSMDNCGITSLEVSPNLITCNLIGMVVNVTLTATDAAGNTDTCVTQIGVDSDDPEPTVQSNCNSDTLFLFSNPPPTPGGNAAYQCEWSGPDGFVSFDCNPFIENADEDNIGFYQVVITGITNCTAAATVQVTANDLSVKDPVLQLSTDEICLGDDLILSTEQPAIGSPVLYSWYEGAAPNGNLLGTSATNMFTWTASQLGNVNFYVIVERGNCTSLTSNSESVLVNNLPSTNIIVNDFQPCEGSEIILTPSGINLQTTTCHWTGPNGYESFNCSPPAIIAITEENQGFYNLEVTVNNCSAFAPPVFIDVQPRPDQPSMTSNTAMNNQLCQGESLQLTATVVANAVSYEWTGPDFEVYNSTNNLLTIPNANLAQHGGEWTVVALGNNCPSETSEAHFVFISIPPNPITASVSPNPVCDGGTITLTVSQSSPNLDYQWTLPNGNLVSGATVVLNNTSFANNGAGIYSVVVTNEFGCTVSASDALVVNERPVITGVANDAPNCLNQPIDVNLMATVFPIDDGSYTYLWTGPNGFSSTVANAIIPVATSANSGPYTLTVTNGDGCTSIAATTSVIIAEEVDTPSTPAPNVSGPYCEGEAILLTTSPNNNSNVQYIWETPVGTIVTTVPTLVLDPIELVDAGTYTVRVNSGGCESINSSVLTIEVNDKPVAVPQSNSPVCEGEPIELSVPCMTGVLYEWQGPNGFSSSLCNPVIPAASMEMANEPYRVRINIDGCWSDEVEINVIVNEQPATPTATNFGPYCASTENVIVGVTTQTATAGATYTWFEAGSTTPLGQTTSLSFEISGADQFGNDDIGFYVIAELGDCRSLPSLETIVSMNVVPTNMAIAGLDVNVCEGDIIELNGQAPTIGTGLWTLVNGDPTGVVIANPDQANTAVTGLLPGITYTFRWTLSNGACENYSADEVDVFVNFREDAEAGDNIDVCNQTMVQLNATMPISNIGTWTQDEVQELLGVVIVDPADPQTMVTGLEPGQTYIFTWTIDGGCGDDAESIEVFTSNETAFAGSDFEACETDGCVQLSAAAASQGGVWSTSAAGVDIISPNDPNTIICGLMPGDYTFTWFINDGACGDASTDEVVVTYKAGPVANDDNIAIGFAEETQLNLILNDQLPEDDYFINILSEPVGGTLVLDPIGIITYDASDSFIGEEVILYELCAENCECATATATIQVGLDASCLPPTIFTPNNDGFNDRFVIPCLVDEAQFINNTISIFNRWGDEVYNAAPYQNDWIGTFNGEDLTSGTYFYILELGNGERPISGFITLQR